MSSQTRLTRAYSRAKRIQFSNSDKFILFSDCHRGNGSFADDFANNRNIYVFQTLKFKKIIAFTHSENQNSTRLLLKFNLVKALETDKENPNLNIFTLKQYH